MIVKKRRPRKREVAKIAATMTATEWITVNEAIIEAHASRPIIFRWIKEGRFEPFVRQTRPGSQSGLRLIRKSRLLAFLEKQFKQQQTEPPFIRRPGHEKPMEEVVANAK
jgi:hypothetical protein